MKILVTCDKDVIGSNIVEIINKQYPEMDIDVIYNTTNGLNDYLLNTCNDDFGISIRNLVELPNEIKQMKEPK